ncbi:MAG TPA: TonB-dependent receptor [Candidatus Polarisedimenticolaceae bacterium]|nr:TonB-dependent receptor [Candidatus Polarisedimenticolaceae bacterium]
MERTIRRVIPPLLLAAAFVVPRATRADEPEQPLPSSGEESVVVIDDVAKVRRDSASFTDLDASAIQELHVGQDLSTLLGETTNAYSYSDAGNGYGYSYLRIRGFDQSRIAVNINGVPLNTPETHQVYTIDLGDFATSLGLIQIQRGPGTSLYGSPAVGGVVNLETASLSTVAGGELELGAGSFGTYRGSIRYGSPIGSSPWSWSFRAAHVESDGYRDPSWSKQSFGEIAFERFDPNSVWRILLFGGPEETQLAYLGVPHDYLSSDTLRKTNFLQPGETDNFFQPQLQVMNDRRIAPHLMLKNTVYVILGSGYFRQFAATQDAEGTTVDNAWLKRALDNKQFGWIPRVEWSHPHGLLTAGLELLFHQGRHDGQVTEGTVASAPISGDLQLYDFTNHKDTVNLFVREDLRLSQKATLGLEIRGTRHDFAMRDDRVNNVSWDATYQFLSPRIGFNWNVSDRWNVYAQASRTESEPPFNNVWDPEDTSAGNAPANFFKSYDPSKNRYSDPFAEPERLASYEVGGGYRKGATHVKADVYRMQFHNEFVYAGGLDADGLPITRNAGSSVHQGVEVEAGGRLPGQVDLSGYVAVSHDVLQKDTVLSPDGSGNVFTIDYSGNRIALFPGDIERLEIGRTFGIVRASMWARRVGTIYLDNSQNERKTPENRDQPGYVDKQVDPYTLVSAQAVVDLSRFGHRPAGSMTVRLRIDNLLDAKVAQFGYSYPLDAAYTQFYSEFFPSATRSAMLGFTFGF